MRIVNLARWQSFVFIFIICLFMVNGRFLWQKGVQNQLLLNVSYLLKSEQIAQSPDIESKLRITADKVHSNTLNRGIGLWLGANGNEETFDLFWVEANLPETELIHWGEVARYNQQFDIALSWYKRAARANPNWGDPYYFMGVILENQNQLSEALSAYNHALSGDEFTQIGRADVYVKIARLYESSGNLQLATINYEQAFAENDFSGIFGRILTLNGVANQLIRTGEYAQAIALLDEAKDAYPTYEWSYIRLARAHLECCRDYSLALENIEEALRLRPNNKWALLTAGDIYEASGQEVLAQQMYEESLSIDPNFAAAQLALKRLYE